jgi:hypothetical protein
MNIIPRTTSVTSTTESAKPYRGRRLTWAEFRKLLKEAANDNEEASAAAAERACTEG